ncbi:hypothetical protein ACROYT_G014328 [Oculina patagonica]
MEHEIDGRMIVSDSDSDCVEEWNRVRDPLDEAGLQFIKKKRAAIRRKPTRELNKRVAEKRYFRRRRSKRVGRIHPDIGQTIEDCIQKCGVGADMWRRTGVLTFDGNNSTFNPQQNYSSPLQTTRRCPRVGARNSTRTSRVESDFMYEDVCLLPEPEYDQVPRGVAKATLVQPILYVDAFRLDKIWSEGRLYMKLVSLFKEALNRSS